MDQRQDLSACGMEKEKQIEARSAHTDKKFT